MWIGRGKIRRWQNGRLISAKRIRVSNRIIRIRPHKGVFYFGVINPLGDALPCTNCYNISMLTFTLLAPKQKSLDEIRAERMEKLRREMAAKLAEAAVDSISDKLKNKHFMRALFRKNKPGAIPRIHAYAYKLYRDPEAKYKYDMSDKLVLWQILEGVKNLDGKSISAAALAEKIGSKNAGSVQRAVGRLNREARKGLNLADNIILSSKKGYRINQKYFTKTVLHK